MSPANPFFHELIIYKRFIDDILVFSNAARLECFVAWINEVNVNIQFTCTSSTVCILFLDTEIYRTTENQLAMRPFRKATDKNTYLHYDSFHPIHLRRNLPFGQFPRLNRNATNNSDYSRESGVLHQLRTRGYPERVISLARSRAAATTRDNLLRDTRRSRKDRLQWAVDYTSLVNQIRRFFLKHWHLVQNIPGCQSPPQVGFRRTANIRNLIIRSDLRTPEQIGSQLPTRHFRCGHCKTCPLMLEGNKITVADTEITLRSFSTCATTGVVYLLK